VSSKAGEVQRKPPQVLDTNEVIREIDKNIENILNYKTIKNFMDGMIFEKWNNIRKIFGMILNSVKGVFSIFQIDGDGAYGRM
jgi:predicted component of type VI protein secretion system